ncbi:hypothetical protein ACIBL5_08075 [Streptomyces sp. NPDC050516]|uniref:GHMP family kinase ATP-binding protein n=1 Tax=Streptomyces sp. NPDC050516 TaxID=3365621 RepID=UPI0037B8623B
MPLSHTIVDTPRTPDSLAPETASHRSALTHSGVGRGTVGELFQGPYWLDGRPQISLISLPVDRFSWCHFIEDPDAPPLADDPMPGREKSWKAVEEFLGIHRRTLPRGHFEFVSELTVGTGMASSTADIVATLRCLYHLFRIPYDEWTVRRILSRIERSDSVFLDEFALYLSGRHQLVRRLGDTTGLYACYHVEQGTVETDDLGEELLAHYHRRRTAYDVCRDDIIAAFDRGDGREIAACASRSAALSQEVVAKSSYDSLARNASSFGADGVFVAHTGTVIGYLFTRRPSQHRLDGLASFFRELGSQCYFDRTGWGHV